MVEPAGLSADQIEGIAGQHRVAWLRRERGLPPKSPRGEQAPEISPDQYTQCRRRVYREEVESRLTLHGRTIDQVIWRVMEGADPETRAGLGRIILWARADRERLIRDIFERLDPLGTDYGTDRPTEGRMRPVSLSKVDQELAGPCTD